MLKRYVIDGLEYCKSEDATEIEKRHTEVINSHVYVSEEEFRELATFKMCNDDLYQDADTDVVNSVLDQIAIKCLGYNDWIQAYHEIP